MAMWESLPMGFTVSAEETASAKRCDCCAAFNAAKLRNHYISKRPCASFFWYAKQGCHTCQIITTAVQELVPSSTLTEPDLTCRLVVRGCWGNLIPGLMIDRGETTIYTIDLYRAAGSPCPWKFFDEEPHVPDDTGSSSSFLWAHQQMQECLSEHEECRGDPDDPDDPVLPTRILDLDPALPLDSDDSVVKVCETRGLRAKYVALSHCWGDPALMPTKLTAHTLQDYQSGIPLALLPPTFRDAVAVTKKLGIRYLWIDSLCIIQGDHKLDSPEDAELSVQDWMRESTKMCAVYQNSHATIAAASAADCKGGLFFRPKTVTMEGNDELDGPYQVYARLKANHEISRFPLLSRGWVTQESLLSPRTIFFGKSELLWQCRRQTTCQCMSSRATTGGLTSNGDGPFDHNPEFSKLPGTAGSSTQFASRGQQIRKWHEIIANYSITSLTYHSDKLTAVQGLVEYVHRFRSSEYLAGLWVDSLPLDLLWHVGDAWEGSTRVPQGEPPTKTPWSSDKWPFPTWSWASYRARVTWDSVRELVDCPVEAYLVSRVEDGNREDQSSAPPGCELVLRGTIVKAPLEKFIDKKFNGEETFFPDYDGERAEELTAAFEKDSTVYCLRTVQWEKEYRSLVLRCIDKARGVYERLGVLQFKDKMDGMYYVLSKGEDLSLIGTPAHYGLPEWWQGYGGDVPQETVVTIV